MSIIRLNLADNAANRAANLGKDELLSNVYPEIKGQSAYVLRRFGYTAKTAYAAGTALGLFNWNEQSVSVIGTTVRLGTTVLGGVDGTSVYQYTTTGANTGFFLKNNAAGYVYNGSAFGLINSVNFYPAQTVPGVVYLDGFVFVLTPDGRVYNSNVNSRQVGMLLTTSARNLLTWAWL